MKLHEGRYQTATQVKVLSPVINNVIKVDSFHLLEDKMNYLVMVRDSLLFRGLRPWYDIERNLEELGRSKQLLRKKISVANLKKKENRDGCLEVGLIHSRGVTEVTLCETVSVTGTFAENVLMSNSHSKGLALLCKGKRTHDLTNELEISWIQN